MTENTNDVATKVINDHEIDHLLQKEIIRILANNGPMIRGDIVKLAKPYKNEQGEIKQWSRTHVHTHLDRLSNIGLIIRRSKPNGKQGRPNVFFELVA